MNDSEMQLNVRTMLDAIRFSRMTIASFSTSHVRKNNKKLVYCPYPNGLDDGGKAYFVIYRNDSVYATYEDKAENYEKIMETYLAI